MVERKSGSHKTKKAHVEHKKGGGKVYGPYEGSEGRKIYVTKTKSGKTSSTNAARYEYEKKHGKLSRKTHVDHKDNDKSNDSSGNLQAVSARKNIGWGNQDRQGKKRTSDANTRKKPAAKKAVAKKTAHRGKR